MRIAILTNDDPNTPRGGAGVIVAMQRDGLIARGFEVEIFVASSAWRAFGRLRRFVFHLADLRANPSFVSRIVEWRPDVLITHNVMGCGFATAKKIQGRSHARWIHILHDVQLVEPSGQLLPDSSHGGFCNSLRCVWSFIHQIVFGAPDVVCSPTQWLLNFHQSFGWFTQKVSFRRPQINRRRNLPSEMSRRQASLDMTQIKGTKTKILLNPIRIRESSLDSPRRRSGGNDRASNTVLYVGRLDRDKGVEWLVRVWQSLGADRPELYLVGDGELRPFLERSQDEKLHIHGVLLHEDVLSLMQQIKIVIVPSLICENQPTVILEAIVNGCAVIATDVGGIKETLDGIGRLIVPGKDEDLRRALLQPPAIDPSRYRKFLQDHSEERVLDGLIELFSKTNT